VRTDSGVQAGSVISDMYDPMVAKLVTWDVDRESARKRMLRALEEYVVEGPTTLIPFHIWLLNQQEFIDGGACHAAMKVMSEENTPLPPRDGAPPPAPEAPEAEPVAERSLVAEVSGRRFDVRLFIPEKDLGPSGAAPAPKRKREKKAAGGQGGAGATGEVHSPMQGTVLSVAVTVGQEVAAGDVICIVEAMKMENEVTAHTGGAITSVHVEAGQGVAADELVAVIGGAE
jgi:acetyl-CoA/propionyl-CoA carboxylase biotin carboxyl carrier protein